MEGWARWFSGVFFLFLTPFPPPSPTYHSGNPFVEDPYTGARFQPACEGALSPVGGLSKIGASAMGLAPLVGGSGR